MKKLDLRISKTNIKNGEQTNPGKCPIANSIMESVKNVIYVSVLPNEATIKVKKGNKIVAYRGSLPKEGNQFVKNFDDGLKVTPFKMSLNLNKLDKKIADLV